MHNLKPNKLSGLALSLYQDGTLDDEPAIHFVDKLIDDAIKKNISDIHLEPFKEYCRIRFRCDGLLYEAAVIPLQLATRVITRLKIMANLNIAERRLPQDGHILFKRAENTDIRINTCPALHGEKVVLRIFDTRQLDFNLDALGLLEMQKQLFIAKLLQPQGLILVTGPTGSGKTMTLYSALKFLHHVEKNISTVEDPVEIEFPGIHQVNIHTQIGLDFATVLRTLLRQDPDIIMIGEIRDRETANIAVQAAQTGHLVLSTLHTSSALEALTRLQFMQVDPYNLATSLSLIAAQRLVRVLCEKCKEVSSTSIGYQARGCEYCFNGYKNRTGIFEIIPITNKMTELILSCSANISLLDETKNYSSLWKSGLEKVHSGIISYTELTRVLGSPN